jgi:hypothetical protein
LKAFFNMDQERIIAVGLLTRQDLNLLGPTFSRAWPVEEIRAQNVRGTGEHEAPDFAELLRAIDEADEQMRHQENAGRSNLIRGAASGMRVLRNRNRVRLPKVRALMENA